uniref:Oxidoreductase dhs-27 n=1 Tax=Ascaris suum TaxID=6253 RepID=F1L6U6_ASCSU
MNTTDTSVETAHEMPEGDSADNDVFVLGTNVSWAYLEERLRRALGTNAKFGSNRRIESIGVGQGFMSVMGRLYPEWMQQQDALPRSFIVKIPSAVASHAYLKSINTDTKLDLYNERTEQEIYEDHEHLIQQVHNTECGFYELSESLAEKLKVPKAFVIERFVEGFSQGILILEDLFDAYIVPTYSNLTVDEATQVIDALSKVHAYSLCNDSWLRVSKADLKDLFVANNESPERMMQILELSADLDHERLDERIKKLRGIFSDVFDLDFEGKLYKQMGLKPVMIHGDLWCSNVMWRGEEGSRYLAALIDWQLVHPGCPSQDLARFITGALSGEDRRKHSENLLERYFVKLEENLGHKAPFTLQQIKESFFRLLPFHMFLILLCLGPLVLHQVQKTMPEKCDSIRVAMVDKAVTLLDDIFYYHELNSKTPRFEGH